MEGWRDGWKGRCDGEAPCANTVVSIARGWFEQTVSLPPPIHSFIHRCVAKKMHRKLESWAQQYTVLLSSGLEEQRRRFEDRLAGLHAAYAPPAPAPPEGEGGGGGKGKKAAKAAAAAARTALTGEQVRVWKHSTWRGEGVCAVCGVVGWGGVHSSSVGLHSLNPSDPRPVTTNQIKSGGGGPEAGAAAARAPVSCGAGAIAKGV